MVSLSRLKRQQANFKVRKDFGSLKSGSTLSIYFPFSFPLFCRKGWNRIWIFDFRVKALIYWLVQKLSASYMLMQYCSGNLGTKGSFGVCFS